MENFHSLLGFLDRLEQNKFAYRLNKVREGIMVEIAVPGQRWEVEFMHDGTIEVEKFCSDGTMYNHNAIDTLFRDFSDDE